MTDKVVFSVQINYWWNDLLGFQEIHIIKIFIIIIIKIILIFILNATEIINAWVVEYQYLIEIK